MNYARISYDYLASKSFNWEITDEENVINERILELKKILNPPCISHGFYKK